MRRRLFQKCAVHTILHIYILISILTYSLHDLLLLYGGRGRDRMVVGFTTTYAISTYHPLHL